MAIRENIISIIGAKKSTTGEGNGVKSHTPQTWLINDTDLFQIKPLLIGNKFTDFFYNVSSDELLLWDDKFNIFKPLNGTTEKQFNGTGDTLLFQDDFCEIRWNSTNDQLQFRVKGNIGWFDAGFMLTKGNSTVHKCRADNIDTHIDPINWSDWKYWSDDGSLNLSNSLDVYGAIGFYSLTKETNALSGEVDLPTYFIDLTKGDITRVTISIKRILNK